MAMMDGMMMNDMMMNDMMMMMLVMETVMGSSFSCSALFSAAR